MHLSGKLLHRQSLGDEAVGLQTNGRHQGWLRAVGDEHHATRRVFKKFDVFEQRHTNVAAVKIDKDQIRMLISRLFERIVGVVRDATHRARYLFADQFAQSPCKKRTLVKN